VAHYCDLLYDEWYIIGTATIETMSLENYGKLDDKNITFHGLYNTTLLRGLMQASKYRVNEAIFVGVFFVVGPH